MRACVCQRGRGEGEGEGTNERTKRYLNTEFLQLQKAVYRIPKNPKIQKKNTLFWIKELFLGYDTVLETEREGGRLLCVCAEGCILKIIWLLTIDVLFFFPVPPTVVVFPAEITAVEGSTVVLPCTAEGNPTPHVVWIAPNGTVLQNRTTDTNLTLPNVSRHSSGTYQCNVTNELGSDLATVNLDVWCKCFSFWDLDVRVYNYLSRNAPTSTSAVAKTSD